MLVRNTWCGPKAAVFLWPLNIWSRMTLLLHHIFISIHWQLIDRWSLSISYLALIFLFVNLKEFQFSPVVPLLACEGDQFIPIIWYELSHLILGKWLLACFPSCTKWAPVISPLYLKVFIWIYSWKWDLNKQKVFLYILPSPQPYNLEQSISIIVIVATENKQLFCNSILKVLVFLFSPWYSPYVFCQC